MAAQRQGRRGDRKAESLVNCLRKFLTPAVLKQAQQHPGCPKGKQRWCLQPLLLVLLTMTWVSGDSQPERFETARAFCVVLLPKRRRPGRSVQGFHKALARVPVPVLRALAAAVRTQLLRVLGGRLTTDGFVVLGGDGSRLRCPRTPELEARLGKRSADDAAPQVWLTAVVHVATGLLWSWRIGKGDASERHHLHDLIGTLPKTALIVADAGYQSYLLTKAIGAAGLHMLVRASTQTTLYTAERTAVSQWQEGIVYWWTHEAQRQHLPPLKMRLLRVRGRKHDVWLLTTVLDADRLPYAAAARFYKLRWANEGFFRTYKRTLGKVKLQSRTIALVHREVEGSLLAVQLLLAQGTYALAVLNKTRALCSARQALQEIRAEIAAHLGPRQKGTYLRRLAQATRECRQRTSDKVSRPWTARNDHKPPKPPKLRKIDSKQKQLLEKQLQAA
jgi:Transposase DDE domain